MTLAYLTATEARARLIASGEYDDTSAPQAEALEFLLSDIEVRIDEWLGYRAAPTDYADKVPVNDKGSLILPNYPVLNVVNGYLLFPQYPGIQQNSMEPKMLPIQWTTGRIVVVGYPKFDMTDWATMIVLVNYRAGLDPLPGVFKLAAFQVLKFLALNGEDFAALETPSRDVTSLSVPGMSKSYRVNAASHGALQGSTAGESQLDRLLATLSRHRRLHIT